MKCFTTVCRFGAMCVFYLVDNGFKYSNSASLCRSCEKCKKQRGRKIASNHISLNSKHASHRSRHRRILLFFTLVSRSSCVSEQRQQLAALASTRCLAVRDCKRSSCEILGSYRHNTCSIQYSKLKLFIQLDLRTTILLNASSRVL